tara:strand:+ start:63 stop:248 length:186 start_codon:yes stop_codon:yes gene_type:complete
MPRTTTDEEHSHYWNVNSNKTGPGGKTKDLHTHPIRVKDKTDEVYFIRKNNHTHKVTEFVK